VNAVTSPSHTTASVLLLLLLLLPILLLLLQSAADSDTATVSHRLCALDCAPACTQFAGDNSVRTPDCSSCRVVSFAPRLPPLPSPWSPTLPPRSKIDSVRRDT
jgi:hypothetical protein